MNFSIRFWHLLLSCTFFVAIRKTSSTVHSFRPHRLKKTRPKEIWEKILVMTVPGRPHSVNRIRQLDRQFKELGLAYEKVEGPFAEKYCPSQPFNKTAFRRGHHQGIGLLLKEFMIGYNLSSEDWENHDFPEYHLHLFQAATLTAHIRAWKVASRFHKTRPKDYFMILEDDATVTSLTDLRAAVAHGREANADLIYLDTRNCRIRELGDGVVVPNKYQAGAAGYIVSAKAASMLHRNIPMSMPVDWGINVVAKDFKLTAFCPVPLPIEERKEAGRKSSVAHACENQSKSVARQR